MTLQTFAAPESDDERRACAAWVKLSTGVMRGLTHSLGNRVHAFDMTLSSLAPGEPVTDDIAAVLSNESAACAELVRLYRLLNFAGTAEPEACRFTDSLPDAVTLWGYHAESDGLAWKRQIHGEPPAILVPPLALTQAVLLLFVAHAQHVDPDGASLTLDVRGADGSLVATFSAPTAPPTGDAAAVAARWLLRSGYATVAQSEVDGRAVTTIQLPSLAKARALQKGA